MNGIETMANALVPNQETALVDQKEDRIIQACLEEMEHAIDSFNGAKKNAFDACITLGNAAGMVREKLPHGAFGPWVTEHFGEKSDHPMSIQWIRICINAAKVVGSIKSESKKRKLLTQYSDVRAVASLLPIVEAGNDPLEPPVEAGEGAEVTEAEEAPAQRAPGRVQLSAEALSAFPEIGKREKELDKREKELDRREEKLNAREAKLDAREAKLKALAASLKGKKVNGKAKKVAEPEPTEEEATEETSEDVAALVANAEPPGRSAEAF